MDGKYIAAAVPFFFVLIAIELLYNRRKGDPLYAFSDSITNLSCGIGQQVLGVLLRAVPLLVYAVLYEHARLFTISPRSVLAWIAMLFLVDLCYWTYHLASHRVNFLWASHIVHHQSEEYNLSVALRQAWFAQTMSWFFYLPLALLGFPPIMYVTMVTLNTLYQFWIHTRAVRRLGFLEWFMNTPSHHRVHHGIDPEYIDKNYAGIFIIWDRLFRTFTPEAKEPVYGTVTPLSSWSPLWANIEHWVKMWRMSQGTARLRDKVLIWLKGPEWRPADLGGPVVIPPVSRAGQRKYAAAAPRAVTIYVAVHFAVVLVAATLFLVISGTAPRPAVLVLAGAILLGLISFGGLLEGRGYALPLEALRLGLSVAAAGLLFRQPVAVAVALALALGSLAWALLGARAPQHAASAPQA